MDRRSRPRASGQRLGRGRPTAATSGDADAEPTTDQRGVEQPCRRARLDQRVPAGVQQAGAEHGERDASVSVGVIGERRGARRARVEEVRERRRGRAGQLGQVVPQAHAHRVGGVRLRDERGGLRRRRTRRPAARGCAWSPRTARRSSRRASRTGSAWRRRAAGSARARRRRRAAQERQRDVLVQVVDAAQRRRLALVVEQVAEVVQQRAVTSAGAAPARSARCAVCSACSSCVTGSPCTRGRLAREQQHDVGAGSARACFRLALAGARRRRRRGAGELRLADPRRAQHAGLLEDRVGDRADVRVDALAGRR